MHLIVMVSPTRLLAEAFQKIAIKMNVDIKCVVASNMNELEAIVEKYKGAEVFISRGGLAESLRDDYFKVVISINISTQNILRTISIAAAKHTNLAVAIYNKHSGTRQRFELADRNILWEVYQSEAVGELLKTFKVSGVTAVIGSKSAVKESEKFGLDGYLIETDDVAIKATIQEACAVLEINQIRNEKQNEWQKQVEHAIEALYQTISAVNIETERLYASSEEITALNHESHSMLQSLENNLYEVSEIIQVVKRISRQTNLIGINASIEAARAGTLGNGFAVVAEEVSKLANESSRSSYKIEDKVTQFLKNLKVHLEKNGVNSELVEEQSIGIGEINTKVGNLENVCKALKSLSSLND